MASLNREDNCGLVIATFQSLDDRRKVLSVKSSRIQNNMILYLSTRTLHMKSHRQL
jgi:hypothetical protein